MSDAPTPRTTVFTIQVEFGDCDPARIVWFPNFFRWNTCVTHWGNKSFTFLHRVMRDTELIMECTEVRLFAGAKEGKVPGIVGLPIPDEVRRLCQA